MPPLQPSQAHLLQSTSRLLPVIKSPRRNWTWTNPARRSGSLARASAASFYRNAKPSWSLAARVASVPKPMARSSSSV